MDFFKSVFSDESSTKPPQSPESAEDEDYPELNSGDLAGTLTRRPEEDEEESENSKSPSSDLQETLNKPDESSQSSSPFAPRPGGWNFGSIFKTISAKSEQVIQSYRRDLDEFRVGLTEETAVVARAVASKIPVSLETGASVAQESLESVGNAIDVVFRSTADLIVHGKDAILALENNHNSSGGQSSSSGNPKKYSRFELQLRALQSDPNSYTEEPDDGDDFGQWKLGFSLDDKESEVDELISEGGIVAGFYSKFVPKAVDSETFWMRYLYRVHKLKQVEEARADLVKRVISGDNEEDLSWEIDDEDVGIEPSNHEPRKTNDKDENTAAAFSVSAAQRGVEESIAEEIRDVGIAEKEKVDLEETHTKIEKDVVEKSEKGSTDSYAFVENHDSASIGDGKGSYAMTTSDEKSNLDEKCSSEGKTDAGESCKDSDFSIVSSQVSAQEEDDLGWDEIEDIGDNDEKKLSGGSGSPVKVDVRKRLSVAEDDEDLSWDIEDDDSTSAAAKS